MGRRTVSRQPNGGATDRFRQTGALHSARGDATILSQAMASAQMPSSYVDYGYTDTSFQGSSLPQGGTQLQPYPPDFSQQQSQQPPPQQHQQPPFNQYEEEVVYSIQQQGPTHGSFTLVPQYPARQSAATIEALTSQFAVPQYYPAGEPTETVGGLVSPYLNSNFPPSATYQRSSAPAQSFPANMADLTNPLRTAAGQQEQQSPAQPPQQTQQPQQSQSQPHSQPTAADPVTIATTNLEDGYAQFQRAIRVTLNRSRAGDLVDAGRSIMEISEWLVANMHELGMFSFCLFYFSAPAFFAVFQ